MNRQQDFSASPKGGWPECGAAESIAEAIQQRQDYATKSDVKDLRTEIHALHAKIDKQGAALRGEIARLETRMNRIYLIAIGQAGLIVAFGIFA